MPKVPGFGSLSAHLMLHALFGLGYEVEHQKGSHRKLVATGRPTLIYAFHPGRALTALEVRRVLVNDVGLTLEEAKEVYRRA